MLLGRALVAEPDLLLLDEPTNHLDIDAIQWLERYVAEFGGALLFVTHDRAFLRRLATRIIELDRGRLTSWPGSYETYLERKEAALDAEARDLGTARQEARRRRSLADAAASRRDGRGTRVASARCWRCAQIARRDAQQSGQVTDDDRPRGRGRSPGVRGGRCVRLAFNGVPVVRRLLDPHPCAAIASG